jgi:hypothetical protein
MHDTRAILNAGRSIGDEAFLISVLVRLAIRSVAIRAVERTLAQGQPTEAGLAQAQALLMQEEAEDLLLNGLRGERAALDLFWEAMDRGDINAQQTRGLLGMGPATSKSGWDWLDETMAAWTVESFTSVAKNRSATLEFNTRILEIAKEPMHLQEARVREVEATVSRLPYLARQLAPASAKVMEANRRNMAELRCAIAAIAAERYRLAHGKWPERLSDLTPKFLPKIPVDPYDGAPLRFTKTEQGALVYSVGPDHTDDGGKIDRTKGGNAPGVDLGFLLYDVPKRRQPAVPRPIQGPEAEEEKPQ